MRAPRTIVAAALVLTAVLAAPGANAGTTSSVSALSVMSKPVTLKVPENPAAIAGVSVKSKDGYAHTRWHDVNAATKQGYCLTQRVMGYRWMATFGTTDKGAAEEMDLERVVEKDGKAMFERTHLSFDPPSATLTAMTRSQVELHEIARSADGVVVWAFREGGDIIVLARNVDRGQESRKEADDEGMFPFVSADGCPYAGARLDARKPEQGAFVQLAGELPAQGTGKGRVTPRFFVDASISRVARDPEPRLAVRVRTTTL